MTSVAHHLLIDGELVDATGSRTFQNVNPATEEVLGTAPDASLADADRAVTAARRTFDTTNWATDVAHRVECLTQLQTALRKNIESLRTTVVAETGTPVMLTRVTQLDAAVDYMSYYIDLLDTYEFERQLLETASMGRIHQRVVRREAAGVITAITPWNFPFYLNLAKTTAALAAGCTVVLKPAPDTPWSATELGRIVAEDTDIPAGVLNIVTTTDNAVAQRLVEHPGVDGITFTGSTATGRLVMALAAPTVKRVTLELGGKSAAVVLDDADLAAVIPAVAGTVCTHAGQGCALCTRLLVPRSRLAEAVAIAKATMERIPWGDPQDPANLMGPLINAKQRDSVLRHIERGRQDGRIVLGGKRPERFDRGFYVEPTLITDVGPDATVVQEEIFGPVLVVEPYEDDDDAVRLANCTIYGLSGAVFSADEERAMNVARRLRTGSVGVNGGASFDPTAPFGGYKQSGLGREWGSEGLEDFLEVKTIARLKPVAE
jgi:aldehyde dehydrogenase (NAD+)